MKGDQLIAALHPTPFSSPLPAGALEDIYEAPTIYLVVSYPQAHLILHKTPRCRHFTDKETSSERLRNLPDVTQHIGGQAGLPTQVPVKKFLRPVPLGLLFVKEEVDTQSWEASASGHATGSWQSGQELETFLGAPGT